MQRFRQCSQSTEQESCNTITADKSRVSNMKKKICLLLEGELKVKSDIKEVMSQELLCRVQDELQQERSGQDTLVILRVPVCSSFIYNLPRPYSLN